VAKNSIKGLDKLFKDLSKLGGDVDKKVAIITRSNAQEIVVDARQRAPIDLGKLRQGINSEKDKNTFNYKIFAREKYSAYMEFGTGGMVKVPNELKEVAIQFKGKGVKEINLQPRPYLYPAFVKGRQQYLEDLKALLDSLTKKI
jgi:HK97 gp10 family phage protein|tara:strand:+ start:40 stop:471 length:432 start_codon:yes stop_codon:yes gene_type:complete